jgi:peptidoglycan/xylan/chitin deacetylase (PgdA/CDA1 family)
MLAAMPLGDETPTRVFGPELREGFVAKGHRANRFFPHSVLHLPKAGPDGYKLAQHMCGTRDPSSLWEIVLYADEATLAEFPRDLFFDRELVWHEQHFGWSGQIATANVVVRGEEVFSMAHVSDVVQRIARRRDHKTRIERRFGGWHDMLLNALVSFAAERGVARVHLPTAALALRHTDPKRTVQPELFERVYDRDVRRLLRVRRAGDWWVLHVTGNRDLIVPPRIGARKLPDRRVVAVSHDIEAGLGHRPEDPGFARRADAFWRRHLSQILRVEREAGVRATYNVVGLLLDDVREEIEADGHCIAFHSFDHAANGSPAGDQLGRCRRVDYRLKGYRPPRSRLTEELSNANLLFHNFEWLASSRLSLRAREPRLLSGLVRIPVHLDDFGLYRGKLDFEAWQRAALAEIAANPVAVVSLHDCYAPMWIDRYRGFLEKVRALAPLATLDEISARTTLAAAA